MKINYGAIKTTEGWVVTLFQPKAQNIKLNIFDKTDQDKLVSSHDGTKEGDNWVWKLSENLDGFFYQYEITQEDGSVNHALDPFAKSMAAFNWEGKDTKVGKAAFVEVDDANITSINKTNEPQPIIYEAHIRDLTSQRKDVSMPGSFKALKEAKIAEHLKDLGITHIQFLPVHNCYALNELDKRILGEGEGNGWSTNYNWGYDPHNYFSINGWYSSNPEDPYSRINEFKETVEYFHSHGIKVILDVVYNHIYKNQIFSNVMPGLYNRQDTGESQAKPVGEPAVNSEHPVVRQMIVDSLKWFVEKFDVDGFRFDLLEYTDLETIETLTRELRAIKPNIVLHGEAWNWTDLDPSNSLVKGVTDNDYDFAYFNDTIRNAVKGEDDGDGFALGLIGGKVDEFENYVVSTFGNLKGFDSPVKTENDEYTIYTKYPNNNLAYAACHDGHTLWDKINLTVKGDVNTKISAYRQAIAMYMLVQGRVLHLEGTEILYTKPNDNSGQDGDRSHETDLSIDLFGYGNTRFNENTYRTTDYSTGLRWDQLDNVDVKNKVYNFVKQMNKYRTSNKHFNLGTLEEVKVAYKYNFVSKDDLIIDFEITIDEKTIRIIHNFSDKTYNYESTGNIVIDTTSNESNTIGSLVANSTIVIEA